MQRLFNRFKYAWNGIKAVASEESNMKIHLIITILVVIFGLIFNISDIQWMGIAICIGLVVSAEMFNTAIELLVDKISPDKNYMAGKIKDIAAGAVLVLAIISVVVGLIIFVPEIINWLLL